MNNVSFFHLCNRLLTQGEAKKGCEVLQYIKMCQQYSFYSILHKHFEFQSPSWVDDQLPLGIMNGMTQDGFQYYS